MVACEHKLMGDSRNLEIEGFGGGVPGVFIWPWWWAHVRQPDGGSEVGKVGR